MARQPFAFSTKGQDYRDDAGKFFTGTPNVAALYAGRDGIATIAQIGVAAIRPIVIAFGRFIASGILN